MAFTFKCDKCKKRKYFEEYEILHGSKVCLVCTRSVKEIEKKKEEDYQRHLQKKRDRKKEARKLADQALMEKVELEKKHSLEKQRKVIRGREVEKRITPKHNSIQPSKRKEPMLEKKIQQMSQLYDPLLYVNVTVKRIKAIEWRNTKKKVLLNKEREIRHTHKGGWSQEKFQRFVDAQKKKAPYWIEDVLSRKGVLRPPYQKIIIEGNDQNLNEVTRRILRKITS